MTIDGGHLIEKIKTAFSEVKPPRADSLVNGHCEECTETSWAFSQKAWDALANDRGAYQETALLTPEAWRYYLPTIMIWCVRDTEAVDALVDSTVVQLTPPAGDDGVWRDMRSSGFSDAQRQAVASFLGWCLERWRSESFGLSSDATQRALAFWGGRDAG